MKIKPEIKERILNAAAELVAEGVTEPTNQAVLDKLGKGSLSHVSPVMREWRENRKAETSAALEMPGELKKAVETSLGQVWVTASRLAGKEIERVKSDAQENVEAANAERDEALNEITKLEAKLTELEKTVATKNQEVSQFKTALETEKQSIANVTAENAGLTARLEERENQIQELKAELAAERKNTKKLQTELIEIAKSNNQ